MASGTPEPKFEDLPPRRKRRARRRRGQRSLEAATDSEATGLLAQLHELAATAHCKDGGYLHTSTELLSQRRESAALAGLKIEGCKDDSDDVSAVGLDPSLDPLLAVSRLRADSKLEVSLEETETIEDVSIFMSEDYREYARANTRSQDETHKYIVGRRSLRIETPLHSSADIDAMDSEPLAEGYADTELWADSRLRDGAADEKRPNFFIALRVTNAVLRRRLLCAQKLIADSGLVPEWMRRTFVEPTFLHVTIAALQLPSDASVVAALRCFDRFGETTFQRLVASRVAVPLTVCGLSHFRERVLFADIKADENRAKLETVFHAMRAAFNDDCEAAFESQRMTAHITLLKLSRLKDAGHLTFATQRIFELFADECHFGTQHLNALDFCSMADRSADDDYYNVLASIQPKRIV